MPTCSAQSLLDRSACIVALPPFLVEVEIAQLLCLTGQGARVVPEGTWFNPDDGGGYWFNPDDGGGILTNPDV